MLNVVPTTFSTAVRGRHADCGDLISCEFVYHFHHASEGMLVVLRGTPTVRMHDGDHQLREGDVVGFPRGEEGGHQIRNEGDDPARILIVSTNADPDVAEYDSGKVGVWVAGTGRFFRLEDAVEHSGPE